MTMRETKFATWAEFTAHIDGVVGLWSQEKELILFRGQSDARWPLQTTLERRVGLHTTMKQYVELALRHSDEIAATTGRSLGLPRHLELLASMDKNYEQKEFGDIPAFPFLVYLRQHGFPSPLLDWTRSPYIAAYFALSSAAIATEEVSIFVLTGRPEVGGAVDGVIKVHEPFVTAHKRHFVQQSWYTTASTFVPSKRDLQFVSHECALEIEPGQRQVTKMTLPRSARVQALRWLAMVNINDYTLFQTEDALIRTIDSRVFDID